MVKISNGINVFEVTRGAFDGIYSKQGYTLLDDKDVKAVAGNDVTPPKNQDDTFLESIVEKPISQWNKEEVKRFAVLKGIDISGTKNANEAKALIKDFLDDVQ